LLQARPITTSPSQERRQIREAVITDARKWAGPNKTVWVKYNLSEVLPSPTPMTWSILRTMLAQDGGFGAMNRDLGAEPDVSLGSLSAFDLIAGRPMMNLTRMPRMQFAHPPFEYPFEKYKPDPRLARNPKPDLNPLRHGILSGLLRLPSMLMRLHRMKTRLAELAPYFVERFQNEIVPRFLHDVEVARAEPWSSQSDAEILKHLDRWIQRTLVDFARESLKPTVLADYLWNKLVTRLSPKIGPEKAEVLVSRLTHGAHPTDPTTHLAHGLQQLALGQLTVGEFLSQFGHRGPNEMDLAQPRWAEDPSTLPRAPQTRESAPPNVDDAWHEAIREARLPISQQQAGSVERDQLRTYLGLRESAKHHLLRGYALIRRALLELDQRWNYRGGIFFLTREELSSRPADAVHLIRTRKKRRQRELQLELPDVLFSDDLEAIGRSLPIPQGAESWQGVGISPGSTHGSALVLTEPTAPPAGAPYILVCPSTDPAWVPLFLQAQGLVMETGGVLSHGAIVAREFGIPAVAGIPGIVRQLRTGEAVVLDGTLGTLSRVPAESPCSSPHGPF
jgi:pyruvate,water dikinase